jgi:5-methylcytosine-specific restriction endonuclease McrA
MKYKDQLKTSAWLRKKAEIMQRDNFVCSSCLCDNFEKKLEVHHITYLRKHKAWEYPDYLLVTLCRDCHQMEHNMGNTTNLEQIMNWVKKLLKP